MCLAPTRTIRQTRRTEVSSFLNLLFQSRVHTNDANLRKHKPLVYGAEVPTELSNHKDSTEGRNRIECFVLGMGRSDCDVCTRRPHLSALLSIPPPPHNVVSRGKIGRDVNLVDNLELSKVSNSIPRALACAGLIRPEAQRTSAVQACVTA